MSKTTPSPNFDLNAIIRGAQLTIVGGKYSDIYTLLYTEIISRPIQNRS